MANVPIVGFIRYSCRASFARSDFFHSEYLDYRLGIFKDVTLKSFQEQTDTDFVIFLLHSESLPQKYKDIFQELERNNAFLRAIYIPDSELEGDAYRSAVEGSKKHVKPLNGMSINFRIDNDDAVHSDFIARLKYFLKPVFYDNRPLQKSTRELIVANPRDEIEPQPEPAAPAPVFFRNYPEALDKTYGVLVGNPPA